MRASLLLRYRLLTALGVASAVSLVGVEGCGGSTAPGGGADGSAPDGSTSTPTDGSTSTSTADGPTDGPASFDATGYACEVGTKSVECSTHEELVQMLNNPPRGGDVSADGGDAGGDFDVNGCLPAAQVRNGCCNPATLGPSFEGGKCCYVFCTTGCCGRPFLAGGVARTAPLIVREDHGRARGTAHGEAWARDALTEHASIAAFARFSLDLMAFGAPADLVRAAHEAALDEIRHAEAAFALASRYLGRTVAPGPLPCEGVSVSTSLTRAVVLTIHEGCVGEVTAALVASRAVERVEDPAARAALETVAEDESRHAELAFRFVSWAIRTGGSDLRREARGAFTAALEHAGRVDFPVEDEVLLGRHGQLSAREKHEIAGEAKRVVLLPLVDALFSSVDCA